MTATAPTVVMLGATGRTGARTLAALLERGATVRVVVRSAARLPQHLLGHDRLTVVEAQVLTMPRAQLAEVLDDCDVVVSTLGHRVSLRGVFGPPRHLVEDAVRRIVDLATPAQPAAPLRLVLMSSVSVNRPHHGDTRRGRLDRALLAVIRTMVPPARDNQRAADVLAVEVGARSPALAWVVVRPDTLEEGDATTYRVDDGTRATLLRPDRSTIANVAAFMADLVVDPVIWDRWAGRLPVLTDVTPTGSAAVSPAARATAA